MDLSYFGESFHGWQKQNNAHTVQEEIESSLSTILRSSIQVTGSGRTDTGVHAKQQMAHFDVGDEIDPEELLFKLNSFLPESISINCIKTVKSDAHARYDATARTYHYFINTKKDPFLVGRSYYLRTELDLEIINMACERIRKWEDFQAFSKVKTEVENFLCKIYDISWIRDENGYFFKVRANRFLRGMVRAMVGTLIELGQSKLSLRDFDLILENRNRSGAGHSVPAEGLYLARVEYNDNIYL